MGEATGSIARFFASVYGPAILAAPGKALIAALYVIYIALAVFGCTRLREGTDVRLFAAEEDTTAQYFDVYYKTFLKEGLHVDVLFTKVPDISIEAERDKIRGALGTAAIFNLNPDSCALDRLGWGLRRSAQRGLHDGLGRGELLAVAVRGPVRGGPRQGAHPPGRGNLGLLLPRP